MIRRGGCERSTKKKTVQRRTPTARRCKSNFSKSYRGTGYRARHRQCSGKTQETLAQNHGQDAEAGAGGAGGAAAAETLGWDSTQQVRFRWRCGASSRVAGISCRSLFSEEGEGVSGLSFHGSRYVLSTRAPRAGPTPQAFRRSRFLVCLCRVCAAAASVPFGIAIVAMVSDVSRCIASLTGAFLFLYRSTCIC